MLQTVHVDPGWKFFDKVGNRKKTWSDLVLSETFSKVQDQNEARLIVWADISVVRARAPYVFMITYVYIHTYIYIYIYI